MSDIPYIYQNNRLFEYGWHAMQNSYSPYSKFKVGAAVIVDVAGDPVFRGCNIENVSYGCTICAERVAIFNAVSHGFKKFKSIIAVAIYDGSPTLPCGSCRQVIAEFNIPATYCGNQHQIIGPYSVNQMLHLPFTPTQLNK